MRVTAGVLNTIRAYFGLLRHEKTPAQLHDTEPDDRDLRRDVNFEKGCFDYLAPEGCPFGLHHEEWHACSVMLLEHQGQPWMPGLGTQCNYLLIFCNASAWCFVTSH